MAEASSPESSRVAPGYKDDNTYSQDVLRSVLVATKSANELPTSGDNFDYYNTFPGFRKVMHNRGQKILSIMNSLIQSQGVREKFQGRELEEKFDLLIDSNDVILEKTCTYLDEASGKGKPEEFVVAVKPASAINTSWNKRQFRAPRSQSVTLFSAKNISRPQLTFKDKIDNTNSLFVPIIKEKPNSLKPLAIILEKIEDVEEFCHPYELEIEKFTPKEEYLQAPEPQLPKPTSETPLVMVETFETLSNLCTELKNQKEFAVDLEHHSYRTFQGFCCLMQISTREKDYIIDVLDLRSELHILNDVFTDPNIVKVFHGADSDVLWLQRDFGLYVVNLFDTGQAARVLSFAHLSLSYLMKYYCKLDMDKRFQLADWRIRPLPAEMVKYAREDTHSLLYIYDCLKKDLIDAGNAMKNLLHSTFERSKLICLKRYQKPLFSEDKYLELYRKCKKILNAKQLFCLKQLYAWRDKIARVNDESTAYVLPNHMMLQISEALPREQQGILACCNPIPPLVKQQLNEIHNIILKTNESSIKQLELLQLQQQSIPVKISNQIDLSSLVHCPHDIHHLEDKPSANHSGVSENLLPPVISPCSTSSILLKKQPIMAALFAKNTKNMAYFFDSSSSVPKNVTDTLETLMTPFERFKMTEELQTKEANRVTANSSKVKANDVTCELINDTHESINDSQVITEDNSEIADDSVILQDDPSKSSPTSPKDLETSTPLRKRKKEKRKKPEPDISLLESPRLEPPSKKSKTPDFSTPKSDFKPYDYSKSNYSQFLATKSKAKPSKEKPLYQTPRPYIGKKRKQAKEITFGASTSSKKSTSNWPQRK